MDVSIIIVSYNTKELLHSCLKSIFLHTSGVSFEVIVCDNASTDGTVAMLQQEFSSVLLIENTKNLGFGVANNLAKKIAKGAYILYLNSDTVLQNNAVKIFFDYWAQHQNDSLGALGAHLIDNFGAQTHSSGNFPSIKSILKENLYFLRLHRIYSIFAFFKALPLYAKLIELKRRIFTFLSIFAHKMPCMPLAQSTAQNVGQNACVATQVDYVIGADLFVKNNSFANFDEQFFLYYEETDLQYNMAKNGLYANLITGPAIVHFDKKNAQNAITNFSVIQSQVSSYLYAKKHFATQTKALLRIQKIIAKDWQNPLVDCVLKKYDKANLYKRLNLPINN